MGACGSIHITDQNGTTHMSAHVGVGGGHITHTRVNKRPSLNTQIKNSVARQMGVSHSNITMGTRFV
jgi:hypothetical protein